MTKRSLLLVPFGWLIASTLAISDGDEKPRQPYDGDPQLLGGSYAPPQPFILPKDFQKDSGLADWESLDEPDLRIQSVRIVGFSGGEPKNRVDWTSEDATTRKIVSKALTLGRMVRPAGSDLGESRSYAFGGHLGVIALKRDAGTTVIGVSSTGFYLGIWHGSSHQTFYSWMLAQHLDDLLRKKTGKGLDRKVFARLSGEDIIEDQKRLYGHLVEYEE